MARPTIRNLADIKALEAKPLASCIPAPNVYEAFRQSATRHAGAPALTILGPDGLDGNIETLNYTQFLDMVHRTANLLHKLGTGPGDVVSLLLPICKQGFALILGGEAQGIVNAVNPMLEPWQIAEILKAANTKIMVIEGPRTGSDTWEKLPQIREHLPALRHVLRVGGDPALLDPAGDTALDFDTALQSVPGDCLLNERVIAPGDTASYFHTGGTTGTPKLAQHTHHMQVSQIWSTGVALGIGPEDCFIAGLPLFHIGGSIVSGVVPLSLGAHMIIPSPDGFRDPGLYRQFWQLVEHFRISIVAGVPTVLGALLNIPNAGYKTDSVRYALTGGSPLPVEIGKAVAEAWGINVVEGYGMTETTAYVTLSPRDGPMRIGSAGVRLPHIQVKAVILDDNGRFQRDCAVDEIGVVVMKGDAIMPGYVQSAYNAGAFVADGWLNSGDLGRLDKDGYLWITGRSKDLIIRGGHNIDPSTIEETLHRHPAVEMAAAVGKPDSYAGELPVAFVQLRPNMQADEAELQAFARANIPERAATPVNIFITEQMPLTAVGKIFKPKLRWQVIERVYSEILAPIGDRHGATVSVSVDNDPLRGTLATIQLHGQLNETDRAIAVQSIDTILAPFTTPWQIL